MLKVYLARHGQDQDNANGILNGQRDEPLTSVGIQQAHQLADKIKEASLTFDVIYSSPLQRALETAEVISQTLGLSAPLKLDDLIERDFGVMTGKLIKDIEKLCAPDILKTEVITYFLSPQGAETFPQLLERAKRVVNFVNSLEGNILLVSHGDIGKMIYAAYYNLNWLDILKMFHFGNSELLLFSPDSKPEDAHVFKIAQFNH